MHSTISEARRVYRQCKYIECYLSLLRAMEHKNPIIRVLQSLKYFSLMMHHSLDQIVFLKDMGVFRDFIGKDTLIELKKKTLFAWWMRYVF